jgi:hypothetical protein
MPMGYERKIFKKNLDISRVDRELYECDISFICDNLYKGHMNQYIPRKNLINNIIIACQKNGWKFNLYGIKKLSKYYPQHYRGDISYIDMPKLFQLSKINIYTHICYNKKIIIGNLVMSILASGGLLLIDNVNGFDKVNLMDKRTVFIMDKNNYIKQIDDILKMYKSKDPLINSIKQSAIRLASQYSWDKLIKNVYILINQHFFNVDSYKLNHDLNERDATYTRWLEKINKGIIECPYHINVPTNFDNKDYCMCHNLVGKSPEYAYCHWIFNGQSRDFMKHKSKTNLSGSEIGLFTPHLFELYSCFNDIYFKNNTDKGLTTIQSFVDKYPSIDINKALQNYMDTINNE